jgi:hypothetical protein
MILDMLVVGDEEELSEESKLKLVLDRRAKIEEFDGKSRELAADLLPILQAIDNERLKYFR